MAAGDAHVEPAGRHVTVELDSGPYEMEFSYQPIGQPRYGDVPSLIGTFDSENDAELAGARMLSIGNWRSFTVQKRYAHPRHAARACKYGDPACPCQDGDPCHYEGENPMTPPAASADQEARP